MRERIPKQERIKKAERWKMYDSGTEEDPARKAERRVTKKRYPERAEVEKRIEERTIPRKRYGETSQQSGWSQEETRRKETRKTNDTKIFGRSSRETRQNDRTGQTQEDKKYGGEESCEQVEGKIKREKSSEKAKVKEMGGTWRYSEWKNQKISKSKHLSSVPGKDRDRLLTC